MKVGSAQSLRIYIGETDQVHGRPLYTIIVEQAKEMELASATVYKGFEGYLGHGELHTANIFRLSEDLPVMIEIIDQPGRIAAFLPIVNEYVSRGMITLTSVEIVKYVEEQHESQKP